MTKIFIALLLNQAAYAQERINLGVLGFSTGSGVSQEDAQTVEQYVVSRLSSDHRFRILDRSRLDAIQAERNIQQVLDTADKTALSDLGAQFVIMGEVSQVDTTREYIQNAGPQFKSTVTFGLRVLDVSTGEVTYSEQFSTGRNVWKNMFSGFNGDKSTRAGSLDIALGIAGKQLDSFLATAFPLTGEIVSVEATDRKGIPSQVLVTLGSEDGLNPASKLGAFLSEAIEAGGRTLIRKKPVGELAIIRIDGEHLAVFKVVSGGQAISQLIEQGRKIKVEAKP